MFSLVRCVRGEDSLLAIKPGTYKQSHKDKAAQAFKKKYGGKPSVLAHSLDFPTNGRLPSFVKINNDLCPGVVCPLFGGRRVFFRGDLRAAALFVGEAPGAQEEKYGIPFCGPSGEIIERFRILSGWRESETCIINTAQCRPPGNRNPTRDEMVCCSFRLFAFIAKLNPKAVIFVGKVAASFLASTCEAGGEKTLDINTQRTPNFGATRFLHIRHPSYLLHRGGLNSPKNKKLVDETVEELGFMREMVMAKNKPGLKTPINWFAEHNKLIRRELENSRYLR